MCKNSQNIEKMCSHIILLIFSIIRHKHARNMGVGLVWKFGLTDPDLESDKPRKPTKKALLPPNVGFLGKTVYRYIIHYNK